MRTISYVTKKRIIDSATSLIAKRGYRATTTRLIAKKAGLTTGSIYNYFKSKTALLMAIQMNFFGELTKALEMLPKTSSAENKVEKVVTEILKTIHYHKLAYKIVVDEFYHFPRSLQKSITIESRKLEDIIKKIFSEGVQNGKFKASDLNQKIYIRMLTFILLGACNYSTRWYNPSGELSYNELGKLFSSIILYGVRDQKINSVTGDQKTSRT